MNDNTSSDLVQRKIRELEYWAEQQCEKYQKASSLRLHLRDDHLQIPPHLIYCRLNSVSRISHAKNLNFYALINVEIKIIIAPVEIEIPYYSYQDSNIFQANVLTTGSRLGSLWDNCLAKQPEVSFPHLNVSPDGYFWSLKGIMNGQSFSLLVEDFFPID